MCDLFAGEYQKVASSRIEAFDPQFSDGTATLLDRVPEASPRHSRGGRGELTARQQNQKTQVYRSRKETDPNQ